MERLEEAAQIVRGSLCVAASEITGLSDRKEIYKLFKIYGAQTDDGVELVCVDTIPSCDKRIGIPIASVVDYETDRHYYQQLKDLAKVAEEQREKEEKSN